MTSGLEQRRKPAPDDGVLAVSVAVRGTRTARSWATVAVACAILLVGWLLANWLAGSDHVATASSATIDGGTVARVLAFLIWAALAVALVSGVVDTRRQGSDRPVRSDAATAVELSAEADGIAVPTSAGSGAAPRARWTAVGLVGAGALFVVGVYHGLLRPGAITWGDWGYITNASAVRDYFPVPSLWTFSTLGSNNILGAPLAPIESAMGIMARLGVPYSVLERLWFYFPAVALSYAGPVVLARRLRAPWPLAVGAGAFYSVNPYALLLISGGQLTVGVGYALYPWVALAAIHLWSTRTVRAGMVLGSVVGVQAWYDPRTAGLSVAGMVVALIVVAVADTRRTLRQLPWVATVAAGAIFVLLQGAWLIPSLFAVGAHLPAGYTTTSSLTTFSLMSLADGLTVFHPFWPSMYFIALYSAPALWLIVPIVVGVSLARDPGDRRVQVGTALYLVFAALVSGANPPFGFFNSWLFTHVPGMGLFRDPSPYFGPIALGVVVVAAAAAWHRPAPHGNAPDRAPSAGRPVDAGRSVIGVRRSWRTAASAAGRLVLVLAASALVVVSAWPALSGSLHHNLAPQTVPAPYLQVDRAILAGPPGSVLWVPSTSSFAPVSPEHPSVSAFGLEGTRGVGFPPVVEGLEWLGVPALLRSIVENYDIHMVVVSDNQTSYSDLSVSLAARTAALSSLRAMTGVSETALPGLTVFHLPDAPAYPVAVFQQSTDLGGSPPSPTPTLGGHSVSQPRQELAHTSFADGLAGWGAVGDGNDYLNQTLLQAGIAASVQDQGRRRWLHLTVSYGAAVISQRLTSCPSQGLQSLRIRYRTSRSATIEALLFSATQLAPLGDVSLPATQGRWITTNVDFAVAGTLLASLEHVSLTSCEFVLSTQPAAAGTPSSADVGSLALAPSAIAASDSVEATTGSTARWTVPTRPSSEEMTRTGNSTLTLATKQHDRLIVFWQRYDPGWVATAGGARATTLHHVEVDGWANGYVAPAGNRSQSISIRYTPQPLSSAGFFMVLAGVAIVVLGGLFTLIQWLSRLRRPRVRVDGDTPPTQRGMD